MALYETPSRIWRRIEDEREPSSLPSLPGFEHSVVPDTESDQTTTDDDNELLPVHSTPAAASSHNATTTIRLQSSTSSTVRFATSIASRSASVKSSGSRSFGRFAQKSFDASAITSLPHDSENTDSEDPPEKSTNSVPEAYLPPPESDEAEDMSLVDALDSVSRPSSPLSPEPPPPEPTPKKNGLPYDYSISLRSEPQVSKSLFSLNLSIDTIYRVSPRPSTSIVMSPCVGLLLVFEHHRSRVRHPPLRLPHLIPPHGVIVPFHCPETQSRLLQASMCHFPDRQAPRRPSTHYQALLSNRPMRTSHKQVMKTRMRPLMDMRNRLRVNPSQSPIQMMAVHQTGNLRFRLRHLTPATQWTIQSNPLVPRSLHRLRFLLLRHRQYLRQLPPSHHVHAHGSTFHHLHKS